MPKNKHKRKKEKANLWQQLDQAHQSPELIGARKATNWDDNFQI